MTDRPAALDPAVADALPGAAHLVRRAVVLLERGDDVTGVVVRLLEAAGGPDAGNCVRRHLERCTVAHAAAGARADHVLDLARRLYGAAEADLVAALRDAGLHAAAGTERAAFAARALAARLAAVEAVLAALEAGGHDTTA